MKILQIIPRFNLILGGGVNVVYNISKNLVKKGHSVTILTSNYLLDESLIDKLKEIKVNVISFDYLFNYSLFIPTPKLKNWLDDNLKYFDICHLHGTRSYQNILIPSNLLCLHIRMIDNNCMDVNIA